MTRSLKMRLPVECPPLAPIRRHGTGVAIIGCGYWGMNHLRVFSELPDAEVIGVCDERATRLDEIERRFPHVQTTTSVDEILAMDDVEAVVVATGADTHYGLTRKSIEAGKHVLVEKPLATSSADADELVALAETSEPLLVVGHTFLYNAALRKVKEYISKESLGELYYLYARRTNLGPIRADVNAGWDLASHDISIFNYLLDDTPSWVSAVGARVLGNCRDDVAFISVGYECGVVGHAHVSWAEPNKVREVVIVGSKKRVVFNDVDPLERVRVFFKGVTPVSDEEPSSFGEHVLLRDGDIVSPALPATEPLKHECGHFLHCIRRGERPFTGARQGRDVVVVLEAIDQSIAANGSPVSLAGRFSGGARPMSQVATRRR
jgi:predicted dehydrogenase